MKALVYRGPQDIRYEDYPDAILRGPDDALVKVTRAAICGSDLHLYHGEYKMNDTGFIVGHEFIGEVVEVGNAVRHFRPGDRVIASAALGCPDCFECRQGNVGRCLTKQSRCYGQGSFMGGLPGVQTELVSVPAADTNLLHMPEGITDDQAILLVDCFPTAWLAAVNGDIKPGWSVAVIGVGPIGLSAVECAFALGAARVFAIDVVPERREYAAAVGAIPLSPNEVQARLSAENFGKEIDTVIDTVANEKTIKLGLEMLRKEGTFSEIGVFFSNRIPFPLVVAQSKSITFRVALCSVQAQWPALIPLVQGERIKGVNVISHHLGLSEGAEAYRMTAARGAGVMKIVLDPAR